MKTPLLLSLLIVILFPLLTLNFACPKLFRKPHRATLEQRNSHLEGHRATLEQRNSHLEGHMAQLEAKLHQKNLEVAESRRLIHDCEMALLKNEDSPGLLNSATRQQRIDHLRFIMRNRVACTFDSGKDLVPQLERLSLLNKLEAFADQAADQAAPQEDLCSCHSDDDHHDANAATAYPPSRHVLIVCPRSPSERGSLNNLN